MLYAEKFLMELRKCKCKVLAHANHKDATLTSLIIKITISLIVSGSKKSYFPLIYFQVVIRQFVLGQLVIGQFVIGQFNNPITFKVVILFFHTLVIFLFSKIVIIIINW